MVETHLVTRTWALCSYAPNYAATLMIRLEGCIALSGLTEVQVLAIAEHEHLRKSPLPRSLDIFLSKSTA